MPEVDSQIFIVILFVLFIVSITWIIRLELRIKKLTEGTNKENLETGLSEVQKHTKEFGAFKSATEAYLKDINSRLTHSVQKVATVRFDPFKGTGHGGNQSFATAFLDETLSGVVISTIHTRERVGVFSKSIINCKSEIELTPEEIEVIEKAKQAK